MKNGVVKLRRRRSAKSGFSLMELALVVGIIGVLIILALAGGIPLMKYVKNQGAAKRVSNLVAAGVALYGREAKFENISFDYLVQKSLIEMEPTNAGGGTTSIAPTDGGTKFIITEPNLDQDMADYLKDVMDNKAARDRQGNKIVCTSDGGTFTGTFSGS